MTSDKQSNACRTAVDSESNRNHRIGLTRARRKQWMSVSRDCAVRLWDNPCVSSAAHLQDHSASPPGRWSANSLLYSCYSVWGRTWSLQCGF